MDRRRTPPMPTRTLEANALYIAKWSQAKRASGMAWKNIPSFIAAETSTIAFFVKQGAANQCYA
ncbi:MAG: hypothetical protein WAW52_05105 [Methanothrix sp.]